MSHYTASPLQDLLNAETETRINLRELSRDTRYCQQYLESESAPSPAPVRNLRDPIRRLGEVSATEGIRPGQVAGSIMERHLDTDYPPLGSLDP